MFDEQSKKSQQERKRQKRESKDSKEKIVAQQKPQPAEKQQDEKPWWEKLGFGADDKPDTEPKKFDESEKSKAKQTPTPQKELKPVEEKQ